ncbi:MAG: hypothetical protein U0Q21_16860 [Dermatophilaceae bacterium]
MTHRLGAPDVDELGTEVREQAMRALTHRPIKPGVVAYAAGLPDGR